MTPAQHNELIDNRSDPDARAVLEDHDLAAHGRHTRLGLVIWYADAADADAYAAYAAAAAAAADAAADDAAAYAAADDADDAAAADDAAYASDAADAAYAASAADAAGDAAADDDAAYASDAADAADADADARIKRLTSLLTKEPDMRNGLKIIQIPGRYGGWAVTRVGWMRRVHGDEWELIGARTIIRTGSPRPIDSLAAHGPKQDHRLSITSLVPEEIHRLVIRRSLPADEAAWLEHCPRPKDWRGE